MMNKAKQSINCNTEYTGDGIRIAYLDTGIDNLPDFDNRIIYFKDFINDNPSAYDDNGHGSHVAAITAGNGYYKGIAPKSEIVMLKTLDKQGIGNSNDVLKGLEWIYNNHKKYNIKIVNMSIGAKQSKTNDPLVEAVESLWNKGLVVVAAAGNNGPNPYTISSPGTSKKIITVGSSDDNENVDIKKNFSSRGPTESCIKKPDIVAPGNNIISCRYNDGRYKALSGTSMSAPIVSGAIALLLEKEPNLSPDDVKYMLKLSAKDLNQPHNKQGWGLLDIQKLLEMEAIYVRK